MKFFLKIENNVMRRSVSHVKFDIILLFVDKKILKKN